MTSIRIDSVKIKTWDFTPEKYLKFLAPIAKEGYLEYQDKSGGIRREFVSAKTLRDSAHTFTEKPITVNHPPGMISAKNAKDYTVGWTGKIAKIDENGVFWLEGTVFDSSAIEKIMDGSHRELSCGYGVVTTAKDDGTFVQSDRFGNHLSFVPKARCHGAGIQMDGDDTEVLFSMDAIDAPNKQVTSQQLDDLKQELADLPNKKDKKMPYTATLDGVDFELASLDEAKHVRSTEKELLKLRSDADAIAAKVAELQTKLDDTTKELITAKATVTEQKTKLDAAEELNLDAAQIETMIGERMKLWQEVLPFMRSDNADFEPDYTLSPLGIMTAAVKAANPDLAEHLDALDLSQDGNAGFVKGLYAGLNTKQFTQKEKIRTDAGSLLDYVRDRRADGMRTTGKMSDLASEKALEEARRKRAERIANKGVAK